VVRFKTMRQRRYDGAILLGATSWEAAIISKMPKNVPYIKPLLAQRSALRNSPKNKGLTAKEWDTRIVRMYVGKKWIKGNAKKRSAYSVWNMINAVGDAYKAKNPDYKSPRTSKKRDYTTHDTAMDSFRQRHGKGSRADKIRAGQIPYKPAGEGW
jgi:hypothetical protein